MPFPYPKIVVARARNRRHHAREICNYSPINCRKTALPSPDSG